LLRIQRTLKNPAFAGFLLNQRKQACEIKLLLRRCSTFGLWLELPPHPLLLETPLNSVNS